MLMKAININPIFIAEVALNVRSSFFFSEKDSLEAESLLSTNPYFHND